MEEGAKFQVAAKNAHQFRAPSLQLLQLHDDVVSSHAHRLTAIGSGCSHLLCLEKLHWTPLIRLPCSRKPYDSMHNPRGALRATTGGDCWPEFGTPEERGPRANPQQELTRNCGQQYLDASLGVLLGLRVHADVSRLELGEQ